MVEVDNDEIAPLSLSLREAGPKQRSIAILRRAMWIERVLPVPIVTSKRKNGRSACESEWRVR